MTRVHSLANTFEAAPPRVLSCRFCGHAHRPVPLGRGERAHCTRCGALMARRGWLGHDAALAFAITGAALVLPALMLPFIIVSKFGAEHTGYLLTGATALWQHGMRLLAIWVVLCGALAPIVLLGTLACVLGRGKLRHLAGVSSRWHKVAYAVEHWAMPEVHVLAVLVALTKLDTLVDVRIGVGFWCYVAMSFALLVAARSFDFDPNHPEEAPAGGAA